MEVDSLKIITTIVTVLGSLIPAVWFLSTKLQQLRGSFEAHSVKIEEKISNLEQSVCNVNKQVMKTHEDLNELRERVVRIETRLDLSS